MKQVYFVAKQHSVAKACVSLLTDRLSDMQWGNVQQTYSVLYSYSHGSRTYVLAKTSDILNGQIAMPCYTLNDKIVSLTSYLNAQTKLTKARALYNGCCSVYESLWQLQGTSDCVRIVSTEQGVFVVAEGDENLHKVLSEYYQPSEEPSTLWSMVDNNGLLFWTTEEIDD